MVRRSNSLVLALVSCVVVGGVGCSHDRKRSSASTATTAGATSNSTSPTPTAAAPAVTPAAQPAPQPVPPATPAGPRYVVAGWLPRWTRTKADTLIDANTGIVLDEVNLFAFGLKPDGTLVKASGMEDPARIALIRSRGGEVIPTIYDVNDKDALGAILASSTARARCIRSMVDMLDQGGYDGIDIDFEHAKSSNRDLFSAFVADLGKAVQSRGKVFSVTIPGKRRDLPSWGGYDYAALGAAADRVKIMTYGYSGTWTDYPGGPIAPTDWIVKVLDYAITQMPADKIQLGIPFYGYDWSDDGQRAKSVTFSRSGTLLASTGAVVTYEPSRGESHFEYTTNGVKHSVWFSDEQSVAAKAALVKRYGLKGLAIWALGYGEQPVWDALRTTLK
jgi:spore germination protein